MDIANFYPGPSHIDPEVLEKFFDAGYGPQGFKGQGIPIGSISHRSPEFLKGLQVPLNALVKELLNVPDDYSILWTRDGATEQWARIARNFGKPYGINYVDTGDFASRAIKAASQIDTSIVNGTIGNDNNCTYIPNFVPFDRDRVTDLFHVTWNNTVEGIEFSDAQLGSYNDFTIIADATSNIFSRPINWEKHNIGMVYASTTKNLGEPGNCLIIIRNDLLGLVPYTGLADSESYKALVKNDSGLYTNNISNMLRAQKVLEWIKEQGGVSAVQKKNAEKANLLYRTIDSSNGFYVPHAQKNSRSNMNVVFYIEDPDIFEKFLRDSKEHGFIGLKGHKNLKNSLRASIYNMMPLEHVEWLCGFMIDFKNQNS